MKASAILILVLLSMTAFAQSSQKDLNIVFPKGPLMRFHTYQLSFDSSFKGYITYNNKHVYNKDSQTFYFIADENGYLHIYSAVQGDTLLAKEIYIQVKDPVYSVYFQGKYSGDTLEKVKIETATLGVTILNADIGITFIIQHTKLTYCKDNQFISKYFKGNTIPADITADIIKAKSCILIFDIECNYNKKPIHLPPSVFFIK
ncbi:MAG: hypothetical protein K9G49_01285 [Taibaiella sp.]|nr:hypothetical protein [Taibaiella sp.]